jgi:predicted nucleic acid-binding protein
MLEEDKFHAVCRSFLVEVRLAQETLYAPMLLLAEVAGVVSRVRQSHTPGDLAVLHIEHFPRLRLRLADGAFGRKAARLAARHALRGADAYYVTVAAEFDAPLITLDEEMLALDSKIITTLKPQEWLKQHPA